MKHIEPNPNADLSRLEKIFWEYNIPDSGKSLYDFVLGKKEIEYLDRNKVMARMLTTVGWYNLVDIFGLRDLKSFLKDDTLKWIWPEDLRNNYEYAGEILDQTIS